MSSTVFICGECGTGKTLMGASAAHQVGRHLNKKYLALVVGPPHLTRKGRRGSKWAREITGTIPGAHVIHVETPGDLLAAHDLARHRTGPLWIIASRNALKMGPPFEGQYVMKSGLVESSDGDQKIRRRVKAPHCPRCGKMVLNANDEPASQKWLASAKRSCRGCGEQLWQYTWRKDDKGNCKTDAPLFLPSDYIKRKMQFDIGIFDEIHELKGGDTAQGSMLGAVASRCRRVICLTGTLYGGKASDLYFLLWRTCAERMKALGYEYTSGLKRFVETYGIRQRVVEKGEERSGRRSKKKSGGDIVVEKPGIVPTLYTDFLLDKAMFLSLDELAPHVPNSVLPDRPPIEMIKVPLGELNGPYQAMHTDIVAAIKKSGRGGLPNMGLMSALYSGCDCWPDHPYGFDDVTMLVRGEDGESVERVHVCTPPTMPEKMYNKDKAVVDFLKTEVQHGRKCLLYCVHTVKHQVPQRLAAYLDAAGIRYSILEGVDTSHREDWVAEQVRKGVDVIITHPQKVETGLDLLDFPTIVFHSMGLKPFTFRQAGARAWRIGQQKRCRIVVFAYEGTMQEMIAGAMFTKCRASTRLEGQVLADLSALSAENDITDEILEHVKKGTQPLVTTEVEVELERSTSEVLYIDDLPGCEPAESPAAVTLVPGDEDQDDNNNPVEDLDAWAKNLFGDSLHAVMSR